MEPAEYENMFKVESQHFWFVGTRDIILSVLERETRGALASSSLLDVGCGTGYTLERIKATGHRARRVGVDLAEEALSLAARRGAADELVSADARDLPFDDGSFDVVIALDMLEHVDDDVGVASELRRVAKGMVLVTVPAFGMLWSAHDEALHHKRRYTEAQLRSTLERAGLRVDYTTYYNSYLFPLIATVRVLDRVARRITGLAGRRSDAGIPPAFLNRALYRVLSSERSWVGRKHVPLGVSILAVARPR